MGISLILSSFFRAVAQLGDRRFRRVFWLGIGLTFALLVAAYASLLWVIDIFFGEEAFFPVFENITWIGDLLGITSFIFMMVLSIFLMVPVASAITSMFLDQVAQAVEDKHYPHLPPATPVPFGEAVKDTLSFLGVLIGANLVAFIIYALLLPVGPIIFWLLNGYLLGREYIQLAAMRRLGREGAKALRKRHAGTIWMAGILMAIPLSVPLINLLVPILGAATFTHLFHQLQVANGSSSQNRGR